MITDPSGTQTFPDSGYRYTLDDAYKTAQDSLWSQFFGILFCWALFACLCIQLYFYIRNFPNDNRMIRWTVLALFGFEVAATAFSTWTTYVVVIKSWGHMPMYPPQTWGAMLFDCFIASFVHALYAWRTLVLIARRWLAYSCVLLIALLSMGQFSCCVAAAMFNALQAKQGLGKQSVARRLFHAWIACAVVADCIIAFIISVKLYSSRTGLAATDRAIKKVLYVTAPGGAATAFFTLLILILQLKFPGMMAYQMLITCLTKVYSNSVLLCFNLRVPHRRSDSRPSFPTMESSMSTLPGRRMGTCVVNVQRDVEKCSHRVNDNLDTSSMTIESARVPWSIGHHKGHTHWQNSSFTSKSSQDEPYINLGAPKLSIVQAPLPMRIRESPFSESIGGRAA